MYPPQQPTRGNFLEDVAGTTKAIRPTKGAASSNRRSYQGQTKQKRREDNPLFGLNGSPLLRSTALQRPSVPRILGYLGELPPVVSTSNHAWAFDQIRDCPLVFAKQADTLFINKTLYQDSFPQPLRAAFGICAGLVSMNDRNRSVLFHALDAEISELLTPPLTSTLLEDLVRLQAAVLYQTIRLFHGGYEQQIVAQRQEFLIRSYGLGCLGRLDTELQNSPPTWETWILAESMRRTVIVAFKLYTLYSSFRHGICSELKALQILPVSMKLGSWLSQDTYLQYPEQDETMRYIDFTSLWVKAPREPVEPFEKFLLVGCDVVDRLEPLTDDKSLME